LIDESASRLRLQQESKPEEIELLDRAIITLNIERAALQKEKDPNSRERLKKITRELDEKGRTLDELMQKWHAERELLQKEKSAKAKLEEAKRELDNAQRRGDWSRASELAYGVIPEYEALLKKKSKYVLQPFIDVPNDHF
jgi:ATP-dependent Clp protease ATP-binding subunit ClpB